MNVIEKVKELNFPLGYYVVIGAGLLQVLGLRDTQDVDLAVTNGLFEQLRSTGKWGEREKWGKPFLFRDDIEISNKLSWDGYTTTIEHAIETALIIDGVAFLNIEETIKFKAAMGREKDLKDIALLQAYVSSHP